MLLKSGLTTDQVNHIYGYVHDSVKTEMEPQAIQAAILKFYDKPFDVTKHRDQCCAAPRFSRPLCGGVQA